MIQRLVIIAFCLISAVQLEAGVKVSLRSEASVRGLTVTLGEVADIQGEGELVARLKGLELSRSPRADSTLTLTRSRIMASLSRERLAAKVELTGASAVVVSSEQLTLSRDELNGVAAAYVRGRLAGVSQEVAVTPRGADEDLMVPAGLVKLKVIPPSADRVAGMLLVPVQVIVDGELYKVVPVTLLVELHQPVVVALAPLRRGTSISRRDIGLERRDITYSEGKYFTRAEDVLGKSVKGHIRAGEMVSPQAIEIAPVIKRRQNVTLVYQRGNVEVRLRGQALADGRPGEVISVLNTASGKKLNARVVDAETVEVVR